MKEKVRVTPPLLCIEILSPEDRIPRVLKRFNDFLDMGVHHLWLIDPVEREAFTYTRTGLCLVVGSRVALSNSPVYLDLPDLFSALDWSVCNPACDGFVGMKRINSPASILLASLPIESRTSML